MIHDDLIRQTLLAATGSIFLIFALWAAFRPNSLASLLGYKLEGSNSYSEFHAIYVGVFTAQFLLCVFAVTRIQDGSIGDLVAIFLLSQPVGRVLSAIKKGFPSGFMLFLFIAELAGGILLLAVRPGG